MTWHLKIIALFVPILFMLSCAATKQQQVVEGKWEPTEKALLWKLEKKSYKTSYLFGTIHIIDKENFFLPESFEKSMSDVSTLIFEIDMKEMTDIGQQMGMLTKAFMKDNQKLGDLLSEEDYTIVKDHFEEMGLPMMFLDRIKPMFLSVFAGGDLDPMSLQSGEYLSYELEISSMAEEAGKETDGLESMDYQLSLFDSIPYTDQAEMLVESIKTSHESDGMLEELIRQYTSQDLKLMHDYTLNEESGMLDHANILLYNRNNNWIPVMKDFMKEDAVLFAVGAGHLGGEKGVLALLKSDGFELTPLK